MHQKLGLHHHKHTGKLLSHRHTSYHGLALVLLLAGICMVAMNRLAAAADYTVTATVPAALPAGSAEFAYPADGSTFYTPTVGIGGTCPIFSPPVIVAIYEGSQLLGSTPCSNSGSFGTTISFSTIGTHTIVPKVMNFTGQTGASGQPLQLTYILPTSPASPGNPTATLHTKPLQAVGSTIQTDSTGTIEPLRIDTESPLITYGPGTTATWRGSFHGGTGPYLITIIWGDGTTTVMRGVDSQLQSFKHHFAQVQFYAVTVRMQDTAGRELSRTYTAVSPAIFSSYPNRTTTTPGALEPYRGPIIMYSITTLSLAGLWLFERFVHVHPATVRVAAHRLRRR